MSEETKATEEKVEEPKAEAPPAEAKEEADFQYLMRLRRSYELHQSHDED